jgi:hypothetical protein
MVSLHEPGYGRYGLYFSIWPLQMCHFLNCLQSMFLVSIEVGIVGAATCTYVHSIDGLST